MFTWEKNIYYKHKQTHSAPIWEQGQESVMPRWIPDLIYHPPPPPHSAAPHPLHSPLPCSLPLVLQMSQSFFLALPLPPATLFQGQTPLHHYAGMDNSDGGGVRVRREWLGEWGVTGVEMTDKRAGDDAKRMLRSVQMRYVLVWWQKLGLHVHCLWLFFLRFLCSKNEKWWWCLCIPVLLWTTACCLN